MSFQEIKQVVDGVAEAFTAFKDQQGKRFDELQGRVEEIEAKGMTPNRGRQQPAQGEAWVTEDGRSLPLMRKGFDFASVYRSEDPQSVGLGDFMRAVAGMKSTELARKALSEGTDSAGGYAVPTIVMPEILSALAPVSSLMQAGAGIVDLTAGDGKAFNMAAISTIPTAGWRAEGGAVPESDPAMRLVPGTPRSLAFYFKVSRELLADALNVESALRIVIAQAFAKELDRAGLRGSGTAPEPRGVLNTSGIQSVTNGANGASLATTAYANFVSAVQALLAADAPMPSAAIMAPRSLTTLGGLLDTTNQPRQRPEMLRPLQFVATSQIPVNLTVGTSNDCTEIYVGDFTKVIFLLRERPSIMVAKEMFASTGQIAFVCHVRADVAVQYPAAFAVATGVRA